MLKFAIEAPWYTFQKKVKALFGKDPDVIVGDVYEVEDGKVDFAFDLEIRDHEKFLALDRVLSKVRTFGNVTLGIRLFDEENSVETDNAVEQYKTIFKGNPIVKDIKDVQDATGAPHGFVRFRPQVIQFFDDNTEDYNGNWNGLAQDIANEVFETEFRGIHFCTADVRETGNDSGADLCECR